MGMANGNTTTEGNGQQSNVGQSGTAPAGANPQDITGAGGGNIGVGGVPQTGETGFTQRASGTTGAT